MLGCGIGLWTTRHGILYHLEKEDLLGIREPTNKKRIWQICQIRFSRRNLTEFQFLKVVKFFDHFGLFIFIQLK